MFSLFGEKTLPKIRIVRTESEFFRMLQDLSPLDFLSEAQGEAHADIDLSLIRSIDAVITPYLGQHTQSEIWFHNMDFHGDGVRGLAFFNGSFRPEFISPLQALLTGEHERFCIACQIYEGPLDAPPGADSNWIAIYAGTIIISKSLAHKFTVASGSEQ